MTLKATVKPKLDKHKKELRAIQKKIADATVAHKKIGIIIEKWVSQNFKGQGSKVGRWPPFKLGGRRKKGGGIDTSAKLLQDTGLLRNSFHTVATKKKLVYGNPVPYAKTHEEGDGVPVRRMLPEYEDVRKDVIRIYQQHIDRSKK